MLKLEIQSNEVTGLDLFICVRLSRAQKKHGAKMDAVLGLDYKQSRQINAPCVL